MTKFILLYTSDMSMQEQVQQTEDQGAAEMQAWMDWGDRMGPALLDFGLPLGNGLTVTRTGTSPGDSKVSGFSFLEAADVAAAAALVADHPHLQNGSIEVLEAFPTPGAM
ncbi:MAG: hypothetical protein H7311_01440 [Ramlibacter sp.]|nr:hypothetical protein [Cryobacterium sp.]